EELRAGPHAGAVDWARVDAFRPYGGIRIEDDVVCTEGAPVNLTREGFALSGRRSRRDRERVAAMAAPTGHRAIRASIPSALRASFAVSTLWPSLVTRTSSSVRMPMPRHLAATVVSSGGT